ncbi:MAG: dihydroorotase [Clostridia bacterium]|nr:dihydroorotase [Clostridia bacterium]
MANITVFQSNRIPAFAKRAEQVVSLFPARLLSQDTEAILFPGFCDVHVHFREPGFSYKETIASGSMAAARGGYTAVCAMPNLNPVPDCLPHLHEELNIIERDAVVQVLPYGAITVGEKGEQLADLEAMSPYIVAFSDDGHGVQSDDMMREAMQRAKALHKLIVAHCEVNDLLRRGYIHDGAYAARHGHKGICAESEWRQIERDIRLAEETGCAYHVCHISCKESVALIREAKASGVNVTCETAPHYLLLTEDELKEEGRFKMNPPIRSKSDREALLEGLCDGTVDIIATDHAPHSAQEKAKGLAGSAFGIVGLETAFPLLYTHLVRKSVISLERLIDALAIRPRERFAIPLGDEYTLWNLYHEHEIDSAAFLSMGKATPFEGWSVRGECMATWLNGQIVYQNDSFNTRA